MEKEDLLLQLALARRKLSLTVQKLEARSQELAAIYRLSEGMDFLRTGLAALDNPGGDIGSLMEAVKDRFGDMFGSSGTELSLECSEDAARLRPGAVIAMNLTRIIQEALTNIMKHTRARRATIRMERTGDGFAVTITDDGKGFQVWHKTSGFGLAGMKHRVEEMKGNLRIDSSPAGTEIGFSVFAG